MGNPWLEIPLADYEGHMGSAGVEQLAALSELFADTLRMHKPSSVAILGVAGGNGLEHVDCGVTQRVVGIDINAQYLQEVGERFRDVPGLQLHCANLAAQRLELQPVKLVHAAVVFEHAGTALCLENALSLVDERGVLSVVLQRPSLVAQGVGESPFPSLQRLKPGFMMIEPVWLQDTLRGWGFSLVHSVARSLPAGKSFWMGHFLRRAL